MQAKTECIDHELNEELTGVLTAISVVSKNLAKRLLVNSKEMQVPQETSQNEGGKNYADE